MRRRKLIILLGGAMLIPRVLRAQQSAIPRVGYLNGGSPGQVGNFASAFREGLSDAGYVPDHTVNVEYRWAEGEFARLAALAAELVGLRPQVIAATGGIPVITAAKTATSTIPIVFTAGEDPVKLGFVASPEHPGGNLTGATFLTSGLSAKRLELLHEMVPAATRIGMLVNPLNPDAGRQTADADAAARSLGLTLEVVSADPQAIDQAFAKLAEQGVGALLISADRNFNEAVTQIAELASRYRIPTCQPELPTSGGLMSYGASRREAYRQAGIYVGKILDGAKPTDLPVIQSKTFELDIDLKTAKALGLAVPQSLLQRADEVFE